MERSIPFEQSGAISYEEWKKMMAAALKSSRHFEIHCWKDELEAIEIALAFGKVKDDPWAYGVMIAGEVTPAFINFILSLPKPPGNALESNPMTPFFTIALDNGFWSEHYGTEWNWEKKKI